MLKSRRPLSNYKGFMFRHLINYNDNGGCCRSGIIARSQNPSKPWILWRLAFTKITVRISFTNEKKSPLIRTPHYTALYCTELNVSLPLWWYSAYCDHHKWPQPSIKCLGIDGSSEKDAAKSAKPLSCNTGSDLVFWGQILLNVWLSPNHSPQLNCTNFRKLSCTSADSSKLQSNVDHFYEVEHSHVHDCAHLNKAVFYTTWIQYVLYTLAISVCPIFSSMGPQLCWHVIVHHEVV